MPQLTRSPDDAPVHVVQLTDSHLFAEASGTLLGMNTRDSLRQVVERVRLEQPRIDLLLCTGDLSQDGTDASYDAFRQATAPLAATARWLSGNHDETQVMARVAKGTELVEAVTDIGNWRIVMLDSSVSGATYGWLGDDQLELLDQALAGADGRHCLVCFHHQPVDIGCAWIAPIGLRNAEALLTRLHAHANLRVLLWGHVHQEWDQLRDGRRLLASPSTCIQFAPQSEDFKVSEEKPGYRWLRLYPDGGVETGVSRVEDFDVRLDFDSGGY